MICPSCKKETPTIFRYCQNCHADLEEYRSKLNKSLEGTGDDDLGMKYQFENYILKLGPIGGIILMLLAMIWFLSAIILGEINFYPPVMFVIGLSGFISIIKRNKKRKKLQKMKKSGEIVE